MKHIKILALQIVLVGSLMFVSQNAQALTLSDSDFFGDLLTTEVIQRLLGK